MFFIAFFGLMAIILTTVPVVALQPVLLYVGITMAGEVSHPTLTASLSERYQFDFGILRV